MSATNATDRPNPYASPAVVAETNDRTKRVAFGWIRWLIAFQAGVIVVSLVMEAYFHETIIFSGPFFAFVGLLIAVFSVAQRNYFAVLYGCSAIGLAILVFFLVNVNRWTPVEGDRPISMLAYGYSAVAFPASYWFCFRQGRDRNE